MCGCLLMSPRFLFRCEAGPIRKRRNRGFSRLELDEPEKRPVSEETRPESLDLDRAVPPGVLVDPLRRREDENPASEAESLGEMGMAKCELNFGTVTRKCRVMKRRCRSAAGSNRVFASEGTEDGNVSPNAGRGRGVDFAGVGRDDSSSVREWLEELGLGKYADMFEMHEVDEQALPLLTLQDLKEMGVRAVGPRRKLYSAIKQLAGDSR
ncbi:hypothetical protein NL676_003495 [Syzygium grande]|nr:hypothetical protein NL676_003495 [Syzygium grande]